MKAHDHICAYTSVLQYMYIQKSRPATKPLHATGSKRIGCAIHGLPMSLSEFIYIYIFIKIIYYNLYVYTVHVQKTKTVYRHQGPPLAKT